MFGPADSPSGNPRAHVPGSQLQPGPADGGFGPAAFRVIVYPLTTGYIVHTPVTMEACGTKAQLHKALDRAITLHERAVAAYTAAVPVSAAYGPPSAQLMPDRMEYALPTETIEPESIPELEPVTVTTAQGLEGQRLNIRQLMRGKQLGSIADGQLEEMLEAFAPDIPPEERAAIMDEWEQEHYRG